MKNKSFIVCLFLSLIGGMLVNLRSLLFLLDNQMDDVLAHMGYYSYFMDMGNNFQTVLLPGLAACFAGLMLIRKIRLWQGSFLCLTLPFFDAFFQCVVVPLLNFEDLSLHNLTAWMFNYVISCTYSFSIFFLVLLLDCIYKKEKLIGSLCLLWNICRHVLLYLLPPLFPQFNPQKLCMDQGELTKRSLLYGLAYSAVFLFLFFIVADIRRFRSKANCQSCRS